MRLVKELRTIHQNDKALMRSLSDLEIRLYPDNSSCLICSKKTALLKTDRKTCYSFDLGKFKLISGCNYCADHKYFPDKPGSVIRYESSLVAMIVDKGYRVTFDLVVKIGRLRYDDHRQLREIQSYLKCSPAKINLPLSTISLISKRFLEFCQKLHVKHQDMIHRDIVSNGGYVLHFDGSNEQKSGQCSLVLIDSRSKHILESSMIDTESSIMIKGALKRTLDKFGPPLAVVSDLHRGFAKACTDIFGKKVNHILCHYHFLRTFRGEFNDDHKYLKITMTHKWQLQAGLSKQCKALQYLKPTKSGELKTIERIEKYWENTGDTLGTYRAVLHWILSYKQESSGKGLPFDLPFLDLYHRVHISKALVEKIFCESSSELRLKYYLRGYCGVLDKTNHLGFNEKGFRRVVRNLEYAHRWFNKLRAVLFLEAQLEEDRALAPLSKQYRLTEEEARKIPIRLSGFLNSVKRERDGCRHSERKAFLEHLENQVEKYRVNLLVPTLLVTIDSKEVLFVPPRTNNSLEAIFRSIKSLLRRCTGRSKLPKEFGSVGALLPYYLLMRDHPSFKENFEDDRRLTEDFAKLFERQRQPYEHLIPLPKTLANEVESTLPIILEA